MFILLTVFLVAIGLSMDTFSLSLSYGMLNIDKKTILKISISVGLFHFFMPLLGNELGELVLGVIKTSEDLIIGIIFSILSIELIYSLFKKEEVTPIKNNLEILFFSFLVSIDSFSTGIGLDALHLPHLAISLVFMITSFTFTFIGLSLGRKLHNKIGKKAEILGILILLFLSIYYIHKSC